MVLYFLMEKFIQPVRSLSFILTLVAIVSFFTGCATWMSTDGEKATYMVIDLSGGTNATSYPISYLDAVPSGGWTDTYKTTKLVMRKIPKGTFTMGSPTSELGRKPIETEHTVTLTKDFYIGVFEVTQRQWELVMGNRPSYFTNSSYYAARPVEQVSYYDIRENPDNSDDQTVDWPSNSVVNATSFMGKLRSKTGLSTFDLPTESQWEYACRAGTTTALNTGYDLTSMDKDFRMDAAGRYSKNNGYWHRKRYQKALNAILFWRKGPDVGSDYINKSDCNKSDGKNMTTTEVGSYLPNVWGLYDMHGNVCEWCLDYLGTYPDTVTDPGYSVSGSGRVIRGGRWNGSVDYCRSASRDGSNPILQFFDFGFRAAMTLP